MRLGTFWVHFILHPSKVPVFIGDLGGGASRDRTDGLVVANDALSQLSYSPTRDGLQVCQLILPAFFHPHQASAPSAPCRGSYQS
jgi:hypothetical protein